MLSSAAPFLPYLFLVGPRQGKTRQVVMIGAMTLTAATLYGLAGPVNAVYCDSKGPFPEIGHLLAGVAISLPLALVLAWLTRPDRKLPQA